MTSLIERLRETALEAADVLAFYEPKCSKCNNHLGLLAESACSYCRLVAERDRKDAEITLLLAEIKRLENLIREIQAAEWRRHWREDK